MRQRRSTGCSGQDFVTMVHVENHPGPDGRPHTIQFRRVSPGYFNTMRIRLVSGRAFDRHDRVDRSRLRWSAAAAPADSGRSDGSDRPSHQARGGRDDWSTIVGVVEDVRDIGLDQPPRDTVYAPYFQGSNAAAPVGRVVRTIGDRPAR